MIHLFHLVEVVVMFCNTIFIRPNLSALNQDYARQLEEEEEEGGGGS